MAVTITMPQLGETVTEGTILSWAKQVGDTIAEDEVLVEISTDKVDTEMPSPASGVIEQILVEEGETVTVGTEIAIIADAADAADAADGAAEPADEQPVAAQGPTGGAAVWSQQGPTGTERPAPEPVTDGDTALPAAAAVATAAAASPVADAGDDSRRGVLSPVVRKLAAEGGVDLDQVVGTGSGGRITRKDVEAVVAAGEAAVEAPVPVAVEDGQATKVIVEEPEPVVAVAVETQPAGEP
ncbi:MAG: E3 binding domain-containing protein, partial [Acidobacteria bacterium]|nr:E3 binding domain-containing protein [Acidobacteriota bacterium]